MDYLKELMLNKRNQTQKNTYFEKKKKEYILCDSIYVKYKK